MEYEYSIITTAFGLGSDIATAGPDAVNQALAPLFGRLGQSLGQPHPTMPGQGWEVVSHAVVVVGQSLVTTVIFRRSK